MLSHTMRRSEYDTTDFDAALARQRAALKELAATKAEVAKAVSENIKSRARAYLKYPEYLDLLRPGAYASLMTHDQLILFAEDLLRAEARLTPVAATPTRMITTKAAILAGRYRRALMSQKKRGGGGIND